jgi:serine/threonine protein kinase
LKPANVMLTELGIKIMDFGVAHARRGARIVTEDYIVGTPAYMAPEQVLGEPVAEPADVYSVGVMFYRLLTGTLPFAAETTVDMLQQQVSETPAPLWRHRNDLPAWCDTIITRALAKAPANRFPTAGAFRVALGRAAGYSVRRNTALSKLSNPSTRTPSSEDAGSFSRRSGLPSRPSRAESGLVAFTACVAALACVPLLAKPKHTAPIVTTPPPIVFDTKVVVRGGTERDAQLTLADCKLTVATPDDVGHPLYLVPYGSVLSTAYSLGRQPLWSSSKGPAPITGALRPVDRKTRRHWIVVRTNMESRYVVLRFEEPQIEPLLSALQDRTGRAAKIFGGRSTGKNPRDTQK